MFVTTTIIFKILLTGFLKHLIKQFWGVHRRTVEKSILNSCFSEKLLCINNYIFKWTVLIPKISLFYANIICDLKVIANIFPFHINGKDICNWYYIPVMHIALLNSIYVLKY